MWWIKSDYYFAQWWNKEPKEWVEQSKCRM